MRISRARALIFLFGLLLPLHLAAQSTQTTTTSGAQTQQAALMVQQAVSALTGGTTVTDITMTGTLTVTSQPSMSGTITLVATAKGQSQITFNTPSSSHSDIRDDSSGSPTLTEIDASGNSHAVNVPSALSPMAGWFFPAFILNTGVSSSNFAAAYMGQTTTSSGAAAQDVELWMVAGGPSSMSSQNLQTATQHDVYLDPTSLLPVSMTYSYHPYNPSTPGTPVVVPSHSRPLPTTAEIRFSDYRLVQGCQIAFEIQSWRSGKLVSNIQLSSVSINTGATISAN